MLQGSLLTKGQRYRGSAETVVLPMRTCVSLAPQATAQGLPSLPLPHAHINPLPALPTAPAGTPLLSGSWCSRPVPIPAMSEAGMRHHTDAMLLPGAHAKVQHLHAAWQRHGGGPGQLPSLVDLSVEWLLLAAVSAAAAVDTCVWCGREVAAVVRRGRGGVQVADVQKAVVE